MLGLLGLAVVVGFVAVVLLHRGLDEAAKVTGVVSFFLAVAPLAARLRSWSRPGPSGFLTREQLAQARENDE